MTPLTDAQRDLLALGLCPFCEKSIRNWKPPTGLFAPEAYATLRDRGIDPSSGHAKDCLHREVSI